MFKTKQGEYTFFWDINLHHIGFNTKLISLKYKNCRQNTHNADQLPVLKAFTIRNLTKNSSFQRKDFSIKLNKCNQS